MKIPYPPGVQSIGFFVSMPFIAFVWCSILYKDAVWNDWRVWATAYPIVYAIGYVSWRLHFVYDYLLILKWPSLAETRKRVLNKIGVNIIVMTPSVLLILGVFHVFNILGYSMTWKDVLHGYLAGLAVNIIFESLWEVLYIIDKTKEAVAEKERIAQLQLQQEFDSLKEKVNPHFLFNSFNTLSSLISEDHEQASKFLDELSKVYRYLLRNNESGMSTVEQESQFINSYAQLLKTRHGDGFNLTMNIDPSINQREIPSLSLQLLLENAVKHNIVSRQNPIQITITSVDNRYLEVRNNLQRKNRSLIESTGIGLFNIREKYRLLNRSDMTIAEDNEHFTVAIPLI